MLQRLNKAWKRNHSVMVQMPTGTGKTHLMAAVIKNEELRMKNEEFSSVQHSKNSSEGRVLVVAHRRELIAQISQTLDNFGVEHGQIVSGKETDFGHKVQVASIQTLTRRGIGKKSAEINENFEAGKDGKESAGIDRNYNNYDNFFPSLVIIDEAHHALAKTYKMLWDWWPEAKFLGLTATPCRLSGAAFTDLFDEMLQSWSIQEFINKGYLSDFEYVSASPDSEELRRIASLRKRGTDGDYQTNEMATVMDVPESVEHLYKTYRQFANGKKGIVYAIDRQHAQHIAEYYGKQRVACAVIDSKTPAGERRDLVATFRKGGLRVLVNVDIFSEGFDCPEVEFIQLARPTLSLSKYLQQVGRGMRISEGKDAVTILDMVGLYQTFGLPTEERDWMQAFKGKLSGKGRQGMAHPVVIKDDRTEEKELVNLQMVRIRRRNESQKGLSIYLQEGKYGVMKDGKVTTGPVFENIKRYDNGMLYALATYPYPIYRNRTTVIDLQGTDQQVQLYGNVELRGDFLYGSDIKGGQMVWDTIGRKYYKEREPKFEKIGGLDILKSTKGKYELRYARGMQSFLFDKEEVLFNRYIAIIRDILILKCDGFRIYKIYGYEDNNVLVRTKKGNGSIQVSWNGHFGRYYDSIPKGFSFSPSFSGLQLSRAK